MQLVSAKEQLRRRAADGDTDFIEDDVGLKLVAGEPEDMWHANNLILPDDIVKARTFRNQKTESATGSIQCSRVHLELTMRVTKIFFDPVASSLRVTGTCIEENEYVSLGQYHTLTLELNRPFTIWKSCGWDSVTRQTLKEALSADRPNATCAVVMQEGLANICLLTDFRTIIKQRVKHNIPKKRAAAKDAAGGMTSFFNKTLETLLRHVDFSTQKQILLASPGFVAQDFRDHIRSEGARRTDKQLQQMARDAVLVHSSTGYVHSLNEVLKSPEVQAKMRDKRFTREMRAMDDFYNILKRDDGRAWYGLKPVQRAVEEGAVGSGGGLLLINNDLFRSIDLATRKKYVALVDKVRENGGEARVLSSDHESGQRLDAMGGIAAILTYPLLDLDLELEEETQGAHGERLM